MLPNVRRDATIVFSGPGALQSEPTKLWIGESYHGIVVRNSDGSRQWKVVRSDSEEVGEPIGGTPESANMLDCSPQLDWQTPGPI